VTVLRVGRTLDRCQVLGPGTRAVIWVTGCNLRCRGCMTPEFLDFRAGRDVSVDTLRRWIAGLDVDGLTFSGGEPFEQAAGLNRLLDLVVEDRPELTVMAFSGYSLEQLRRGSPEQRALLGRLDVLVDGPYLPERHSSARWRGSSNQRVHWLTSRVPPDQGAMSRSAGVEVVVDPDGGFAITGVPPTLGFRREVRARLRELGVIAKTEQSA
jgi:anaerobic ribonucleoside-triphosphate reductase activating protein